MITGGSNQRQGTESGAGRGAEEGPIRLKDRVIARKKRLRHPYFAV
jgi:hypothetical protein